MPMALGNIDISEKFSVILVWYHQYILNQIGNVQNYKKKKKEREICGKKQEGISNPRGKNNI